MRACFFNITICCLIFCPLGACSTSGGASAQARRSSEKIINSLHGKASWYSTRTNGTRTASGEPLRDKALTAAHRTLPFGTRVRVTNTGNGRQVVVRITDRGPFGKGRIIDLSVEAANQLDMIKAGVVPVRVDVLK